MPATGRARARAIAHAAGRARARPPDRRACAEQRAWRRRTPACGRARTATHIIAGRSRPRPRPTHDARRDPPDGPRRARRAARPDGPDPEQARLYQGHGRRADEGAGQGPALQVPPTATPAAPRSWPSSRSGCGSSAPRCRTPSTRWYGQSRGAAACRPRKNPARPAPMAAPARSTARSPASSGSTCARPSCTRKYQPARPHPSRGDPGPCLAGRICQPAAADPHHAVVQRLFRRLGALRRAARRRARRL